MAKYDSRNPRPLPDDMPLKSDLTGADIVFPTASGHLHDGGAYLSYYDGQCGLVDRDWCRKAGSLFFSGGSLAGLGLKIRPDLNPSHVHANLRWLLGSWGAKHEEKEATVGFALSKWCEPLEAQAEAA